MVEEDGKVCGVDRSITTESNGYEEGGTKEKGAGGMETGDAEEGYGGGEELRISRYGSELEQTVNNWETGREQTRRGVMCGVVRR